MIAEKKWLTANEFAERMGRTRQVIAYWLRKGVIRHRKHRRGTQPGYRIPVSEVERIKRRIDEGLPV